MTRTAPWATPSSPTGRRILLTEPATLDVALPLTTGAPTAPTPAPRTATVLADATAAATGARPVSTPVRPRRPEDGRPRSTRVVPPGASSTPWPTPARRTPPPPPAMAPHALAPRAGAPHALAPHAAARAVAPHVAAGHAVHPHRVAPPAGPVAARLLAPSHRHAVRRRRLARGALTAALLLAPALGLLVAQAGPHTPASRPVVATTPIATTSVAPLEPTADEATPRHAEDDHGDATLAKEVVATSAELHAHRHQTRTP